MDGRLEMRRAPRGRRRGTTAQWAVASVGALALVVTACVSGSAATSPSQPDDPPGGQQPGDALGSEPPAEAPIDQLRVAPESDDGSYDRDEFGSGWIDADGDGCDTRDEVLIDESQSPAQVDPYRCQIVAGDWVSLYDGYETTDASELDIDHVVALGEAWRSGAADWRPEQRAAFANDLDDPATLVAVTAATNRSKGDRDPADWQPPNRDGWCAFAGAWVNVKVRWDLTADEAEVETLRNMLVGC